jgi:transposase InsO family protein
MGCTAIEGSFSRGGSIPLRDLRPRLEVNIDVVQLLTATGLQPKRTSIQAPWQNGIAERWVGSCRREMLDHDIPLNERHLRRLLREYVSYHNDDRIHDALSKDAPNGRRVQERPSPAASIISQPRLGGLITAIAGA